jgi:histidyl-tRNA synthetase
LQAKYQAVRGTYDILPEEAPLWQEVEQTARAVFTRFHFQEIRTPIFEATDLFTRSIGQTTDIVSKEMYTFLDKKERSITLRPEATVCVVRALIENSKLLQNPLQKLYYVGPMFRYEKPQSGRNRQFHQIGVEALGSTRPGMDAEVIALLCLLLEELGLKGVATEINSVGCMDCRPGYSKKLQVYLNKISKQMCDDCQTRTQKNPLRVFDCKNPTCIVELTGAPVLMGSICTDCKDHFQRLESLLKTVRVPYQVNTRLVRGIDYYTKTTFEMRHKALGAQDAVAAGGRYDNLVKELGGPEVGAVGWALGIERLIMAMKSAGKAQEAPGLDAVIVSLGDDAYRANMGLCQELRKQGFSVAMDHEGKSIKAQMRQADRLKSRLVFIRGDNELKENSIRVKDMTTGKEESRLASDLGQLLSGRAG